MTQYKGQRHNLARGTNVSLRGLPFRLSVLRSVGSPHSRCIGTDGRDERLMSLEKRSSRYTESNQIWPDSKAFCRSQNSTDFKKCLSSFGTVRCVQCFRSCVSRSLWPRVEKNGKAQHVGRKAPVHDKEMRSASSDRNTQDISISMCQEQD